MSKLKFTFSVKAHAENPKSNAIVLTSITAEDNKSYIMPDQYQLMDHHKQLASTQTYKRVLNTLKKRGQTRNIYITLPEEILKLYQDEDGNMTFRDYILEEASDETSAAPRQQRSEDSKKKNLQKLAEKFILEKFSGKTCNVSEWMNTFERECTRLDIEKDTDKIETFRLFLEGTCIDWYNATLATLTIESEWSQWKEKFCEIYADKGWLLITRATLYKYTSGSLLDYAIRKRNLLIQINKTTPEFILINLIAVELPSFVRNKIDREKLKTVENLLNEIRGLEYLIKNTEKKTTDNQEKKPKDRPTSHKPCTICEKKNKSNRFHPESSCWYKNKDNEQQKKEQIKHVNNSELELELNDIDQKN